MRIYPDATQLFLDDPSSNVNTEQSRRSYRQTLRQLDDHVDKPLHHVTEDDIVAFLSRPLSPATRAANITRIQALFRWAHWRGHIPTDPTVYLKRILRDATFSKPVRENHWLTEEQVLALYDNIDLSTVIGRRDNIVLRLGFTAGLRVDEIRNLRWSNVDLPGRQITFVGKGRKLASVAITDNTFPHLKAWHDEYREAVGFDLRDEPVVVPCNNQADWSNPGDRNVVALWGRQVNVRTIRGLINRLVDRTGIQFRPHDMRRSFAGILQDKGVPVEDISLALRHANIGVTQRYLEKRQDAAVNVVKKVDLRI